MRNAIQTFLPLVCCLLLINILGCKKQPKPSILVLAIEDFSFLDSNCSEKNFEGQKSGLSLVCQESVRFTHAFNSSTLSVPNIASIITGLYPLEHGVRHNGDHLKASFITAPEQALEAGYRTAFFSGGMPVLRKSGLNQGFEVFEDNISLQQNHFFRPFQRNKELFEEWLQNISYDSFFSVLYIPDLIFQTTPTTNDLGEKRNFTYESQMDELDEQLYELFQFMKSKNIWDNTWIVVTGLNGRTESLRKNELSSLNLNSDNIQIGFFIKPAQKKSDLGLQWKVDTNITIVDLGLTLFEILNADSPENQIKKEFKKTSLLPMLKPSSFKTQKTLQRPILVESAWSKWKGYGPIRYSILFENLLFINDLKPKAYNTLIDRFEVNALNSLEIESLLKDPLQIQEWLKSLSIRPWPALAENILLKYSLPYSQWLLPEHKDLLKQSLQQYNLLPEVLAEMYIQDGQWAALKKLAAHYNNKDWLYVSQKNLSEAAKLPPSPCWQLLEENQFNFQNEKMCNQTFFIQLLKWKQLGLFSKESAQIRLGLEKIYSYRTLDRHILKTYYATGGIWDVNPIIFENLNIFDLALALPEFKRFKNYLDKSLTSFQEDRDILDPEI